MTEQVPDLTPKSEWEKNEESIVQTDNSPEEEFDELPQDPNWKPEN